MLSYLDNIKNIIASVDNKYRYNKLENVFNEILMNVSILENEINASEDLKRVALNKAKKNNRSASDMIFELNDDMNIKTK